MYSSLAPHLPVASSPPCKYIGWYQYVGQVAGEIPGLGEHLISDYLQI